MRGMEQRRQFSRKYDREYNENSVSVFCRVLVKPCYAKYEAQVATDAGHIIF